MTMMPTGRSTAPRTRCAAVLVAIALGTLLAACGDNDVDPEATGDTGEETAGDAWEQAENAFASLRTGAERLLDQLQDDELCHPARDHPVTPTRSSSGSFA